MGLSFAVLGSPFPQADDAETPSSSAMWVSALREQHPGARPQKPLLPDFLLQDSPQRFLLLQPTLDQPDRDPEVPLT